MKRGLVLLVLAGAASVALAQTAPTPRLNAGWRGAGGGRGVRMGVQRMEQWRMHRLTVLLDLTAAQREKVQSILREQRVAMRQHMAPVRQAMWRALRQMRAAQEATHKETLTKLAGVLSPKQLAKFKVLMPRHPWFWMHHMGPRGMGWGMGPGMGWGMGSGMGPGMGWGMGMGPPPPPSAPSAPNPPKP